MSGKINTSAEQQQEDVLLSETAFTRPWLLLVLTYSLHYMHVF